MQGVSSGVGGSLLCAVLCAEVSACGSRTGLLVPGDAPPPIAVPPGPSSNDCPDASAALIYVVTKNGILLTFDPSAATFTSMGTVGCGSSGNFNSMAVDQAGLAYVGFHDGTIVRVNTKTAACQPIAFVAGSDGFAATFGMGFAADATGAGETLYLAENFAPSSRLAWLDTTTFALHLIGLFNPAIPSPELTGTGSGDLFAFSAAGADSMISQIDKNTARIVAHTLLRGVAQGSAWAFAFWGGDFYTFTAPAANSIVTRFRPIDGSIVEVARYPTPIVGAGVSTCAPQQ
jgi:hypothetical protein